MAGRPKKNEAEKLVSVGLAIPPEIDAAIEKIVEIDGRLKGQVTRLIFMRGWAAYTHDGRLIDEKPRAAEMPVEDFKAGRVQVGAKRPDSASAARRKPGTRKR